MRQLQKGVEYKIGEIILYNGHQIKVILTGKKFDDPTACNKCIFRKKECTSIDDFVCEPHARSDRNNIHYEIN
jgi:hypothetical protein